MSETAAVRVYALGSFRIETPAGVKDRLPTRKATALLAQLALDPRPHSRQSLQVEYWPDDAPDRARTSLRQALSMIRRVLPDPDALISTDESIELLNVETDVAEFRRRTQEANATGTSNRVLLLRETLDFYAEPLPGWEEWWVSDLRAELAADALDLAIQLSAMLAPTDRDGALIYVRRALDIDPEDEEALALLEALESGKVDLSRYRRLAWPTFDRVGERPPAAAAELEQIIQLYLQQDSERAIQMLSANGEVLSNLGYRRVLPLYTEAAKRIGPDSEFYGRLRGVLGSIYHRLGAYNQSELILRDVVEWSRLRGQVQTEAEALMSLGLISMERGHITPAHPTIGRLRALDRQQPRANLGGLTVWVEGAHRWQGGDLERGWQFVRESIRRSTDTGMNRVTRWNLANMSLVSWELGALEAMQEFRAIGEQAALAFGDRYLSLVFDYIVGAEFILQRRYEEATAQLRPLLDDPRRDFGRLHILISEALGTAAAHSGELDTAVHALSRAYVLRKRSGHLPTVMERRNLRRAYGELERRLGTQELDRRLDLEIAQIEGSRAKTS